MTAINLPEGTHEQVLLSPDNRPMLETWSKISVTLDMRALDEYRGDRSVADLVPVLCYALVSRAAFMLASAVEGFDLDAATFGQRCEAIAVEQIERARKVSEAFARRDFDAAAAAAMPDAGKVEEA